MSKKKKKKKIDIWNPDEGIKTGKPSIWEQITKKKKPAKKKKKPIKKRY